MSAAAGEADAVVTISDLPEPQRHIGNLIRRAQQLHLVTWARVASAEITSAQYSILAVLDRAGEASQRELCDEVDLDRSTIADLVRRMEKADLIARRRAEGDARRNVVTLTEQRELTAGLGDDDAAALFRGLWSMLER